MVESTIKYEQHSMVGALDLTYGMAAIESSGLLNCLHAILSTGPGIASISVLIYQYFYYQYLWVIVLKVAHKCVQCFYIIVTCRFSHLTVAGYGSP